jgi:ABC-type dipeptide/oligopeptide/nickel transport system ATPase subunit
MTASGRSHSTLAVDALSHYYGRGAPVLDGVSLHIAAGEVVGLLGPSGCGKSTLARCLAGMLRPTGGTVRLNGTALGSQRSTAQRRAIQYVWQEPQLALSPYRSVLASAAEPLEVFAESPAHEREANAARMLVRLGLPPEVLGRRPHQLSGGQCQRVVLARALLAEPEVLLLDEPFSALDTVATVALLEDLRRLLAAQHTAVLLVSHDPALVRSLATRVLRLEGGVLKGVAAPS